MPPRPKLPSVSPKKALRALKKAGWKESHKKGSHQYLRKAGFAAPVCIPMHTGDLPRGTLHSILKAAKMSRQEFLDLL